MARIAAGNLGDVKPGGEGVSERKIGYGEATGFISAKMATN